MFRLHEDRRHERDLGMQGIKELLAWGGCQPEHHTDVEKDWPVDESLFDFVVGGYLRGWGMSGKMVAFLVVCFAPVFSQPSYNPEGARGLLHPTLANDG